MAKRPIQADYAECLCGCGQEVNNEYKQGHDARHKGMLLRAFDSGTAEAGEQLVKRGWYSKNELRQRRDKLETTAAKKAATKADVEPKAPKPKVSRGARTEQHAEAA